MTTFRHVTQEEMDRLIRQAQADTWKEAFAHHDWTGGAWPKYTPEQLRIMATNCIGFANTEPEKYLELVQRLARKFGTDNMQVQMQIARLTATT